MSALYKQAGRPIVLTTPLGPDRLHAVGLTGREAVSEPYRFAVTARAAKGDPVPFDELLGRHAAVRLAAPGRPDRFVHGLVARLAQGGTDEEFTHYTLDLVPDLWLLTKKFQSRVFVQKSVPDVLREVFAGLRAEFALCGQYPKREFCAQYRETDYDFAGRLMEDEGIYYFFRHAADGHTLVLADGPHAHPELPGKVRLRAARDAEPAGEEFVHALGKAQRVVAGRVHLRDHHFQLPHDPLAAGRGVGDEVRAGQVAHRLQAGPAPALEVYDFPGGYAGRFDAVDPAGGDQPQRLRELCDDNARAARLRAQAEAARAVELAGAGCVRGLAPGHTFALAAADARSQFLRADGAFLVVAVEHALESGGYRSDDGAGFRYTNAFTCVPAGVPYRPGRSTPKPRIDGVQTAVVAGPPGEEIFTDRHGRVKVHFHWDRAGKADGSNSPWVRVATPHAGKGFGGVSIPRVGEEVVVSFLEGDPDRPLIVGRVYNDRERPPFRLPEKKMVSGLRTSTYPGGGGFNEISLDDTKGKERMFLHAQYDQDTVVGNSRTAKVAVDHTEEIGNDMTLKVGNNLTIDAGTTITIRCGASKIHMTKAGLITISGTVVATVASVNASVVAPLTEIVGGAVLTCVGGMTFVEGGATHVGGLTLTSITAPKVDVAAGKELVLVGNPIKLN